MKLHCAHCRELFEPSLSQKATLRFPTARRYCSHACKCKDQERPPEQPERRPPLVPEDLIPAGASCICASRGNAVCESSFGRSLILTASWSRFGRR